MLPHICCSLSRQPKYAYALSSNIIQCHSFFELARINMCQFAPVAHEHVFCEWGKPCTSVYFWRKLVTEKSLSSWTAVACRSYVVHGLVEMKGDKK